MKIRAAPGIELEAEEFDGGGPPLVLVMGLGAQMLLWPDAFCAQLAERGHRVIRFDNRDVGASTRLDGSGVPNIPAVWARARLGLAVNVPYRLSDMASDVLAVMDGFGLDRATVVGASMGGMIAQRLAIAAPDRLHALVSVMSTSGPTLPRARAVATLLQRARPGRDGYVEHTVRLFRAIGSQTHPIGDDRVREIALRLFERGPSPGGFTRQLAAVIADGDRAPALAAVDVPTLVLHGDEDPLVPLAGGFATAKALRGRLHVVRGMGHDLPPVLWPELTEAISAHATQFASR
jgi:pimeloyl-ACP methyl ester carboxylesterase